MTRFMLPLTQSVDLVLYALSAGAPGDIFVRKSPACTIEVLVEALQALFHYEGDFKEIGIRGGEKIHETLVSAEELARSEDRGDYFRIVPESEGLNYEKYFTEGKRVFIDGGGYTSENTRRLSKEETITLLTTLPQIQRQIREHERVRVFEGVL